MPALTAGSRIVLKGRLPMATNGQEQKFQVQGQWKTQAELEAEAEECFWKAIEIARRQQAKALELRAVMSLAQLWKRQGKREEARKMLAEIYGWFTEGFDTADLKDAKALLEELS
jgi:predicted ATPase